ncbi:Lrp/AsnC family transcriptional regulator [Sulfuriflexus mobilis]|uniref:Lrp/AsnC family transcriptional regulator n=1 Tax=Sulfuriflexus mobilis TaxID=1811807 RepID=UPI000F844ADF|nr:AsnC family transcriptional regulator [Sulfuriflexus mobilis]
MDEIDRKIINTLQTGFPLSEEPYAEVADQLGVSEKDLLNRLSGLLENKVLTRFGPMYDAQKLGGAFSLVAVRVPEGDFHRIAEIVNSYPEVAHNYQRDHDFNMWYVLATETPEKINEVNYDIEQRTGLKVFNMPKLDEYYIGLQLPV